MRTSCYFFEPVPDLLWPDAEQLQRRSVGRRGCLYRRVLLQRSLQPARGDDLTPSRTSAATMRSACAVTFERRALPRIGHDPPRADDPRDPSVLPVGVDWFSRLVDVAAQRAAGH